MSDAEALLALYGAIDRAVVADPTKAERLAPLLAPYRQRAAVGWYDQQYLPWLEQAKERAVLREREASRKREASREPDVLQESSELEPEPEPQAGAEPQPEAEPPIADSADAEFAPAPPMAARPAERAPLTPGAQQIASALAALPPRRLEGRAGARRLLAVTAAALVMPEHFGPDGSHAELAKAPLVFQHPDLAGNPFDRADDLHRRFATEFRSMDAWPGLVESSVRAGQLPDTFKDQIDAPPCVGRLVMRPDPGSTDYDPCTVLEAEFVTNKVTFEEAKNYLEPSNWVFPGSLWCRMEQYKSLGGNSFLYHETVSTSGCPPAGGWSVSADLQFWLSHPTPYEARAEYDFPQGPLPPGSDIEIDEGSLRVIKLANNHVNVKTTKRVRFAGSFDGAGLAMFMCATGYSSALEDMVFTVTGDPLKATKPFPVPAPTSGPQGVTMSPPPPPPDPNKPAKNAASAGSGTSGAADETLEDLAAEAAELFECYVKDATKTYSSSMKKIQAGNYKVEDAWADGIAMWTTYMSGLGKALDLGTRTAKAAVKNPPPAGGTPTTPEGTTPSTDET